MTNQLRKVTRITVLPERLASAATPYRPATKAYSITTTKQICQIVTTGGDKIIKAVPINGVDGAAGYYYVDTGNTTPVVHKRVCQEYKETVYYPAMPEQKAQPAVDYRPRTVIEEFGLGWNAGARSIASLPGNGAATFQIPHAVGTVVGFNDADEDAGYLGIEHGLYFRRETFQVVELGVTKTSESTFSATDTFKIERVGTRVQYFRNGALIYTSLSPSYGTVFLDASMYSGGDVIESPALIGSAGAYSTASMLPMTGFASDSPWVYSRGVMASMTGSASALRTRANNAMLPMTGLAVVGKYSASRASMLPMTGRASAGMLAPAYALSAGQMMPMSGYAFAPEARFAFSNAAMRPMTGMAVQGKYAESRGSMLPMSGEANDRSFVCFPLVAGGEITHFAIVTLDTQPMVGILSGSISAGSATAVLPAQPFVGLLGGELSAFPEFVLGTVAMQGVLGGSITELAEVVLATLPLQLLLGGRLGAAPSAAAEVFSMNITGDDPGGTTQYENYPFNSVAKIGGRYYGATDEGLFLLEGDDDAGEPIVSVFGLGQMNFGNPQVKTVTHCYLGAAAGAMRLEVDALVRGVPASYSYSARVYGSTMREMRFDLGKGLQSTYLTPTFYNDSGAPFEVDAMRFLIAESARRI